MDWTRLKHDTLGDGYPLGTAAAAYLHILRRGKSPTFAKEAVILACTDSGTLLEPGWPMRLRTVWGYRAGARRKSWMPKREEGSHLLWARYELTMVRRENG